VADFLRSALYTDDTDNRQRIFSTNGRYTAQLRRDWQLQDDAGPNRLDVSVGDGPYYDRLAGRRSPATKAGYRLQAVEHARRDKFVLGSPAEHSFDPAYLIVDGAPAVPGVNKMPAEPS
jgi:hypothetical protein